MCGPGYFVKCTGNNDLTKMTLKIFQPHLITKTTQRFDEEVSLL